MRAWFFLALAIISEVLGTSSMKYASLHAPVIGHLIMYTMIALSYYFLALAVKRVPVGVAYALWEGIGIVLITIISVIWFDELLGLYKALGLGLIILGILLIKKGTKEEHKPQRPASQLQEA